MDEDLEDQLAEAQERIAELEEDLEDAQNVIAAYEKWLDNCPR